MRVKSKITLGLVFLFTVIVALGIIAINYLNNLTVDNQQTLSENYKGIENIHELGNALREMIAAYEPTSASNVSLDRVEYIADLAIEDFEEALARQKINNTNRAQEEILNDIEMQFATLKRVAKITRTKDYYFDRLLPLAESISLKIDEIFLLNQSVIISRNEKAKITAENVIYTVAVIVVFCVLVAFSFMVSFPRYVAEPVEIMTSTINKMEAGDYSKRIEFESKDEFGVMAKAFNKLFDRLEEYEKLNLHKIVIEKKRMDTLIKKLNEGIIGLDQHLNFIFMNPFAKDVLGIGRQKVKGKSATETALQYSLFSNLLEDIVEWQNTGQRFTRNKLIKGEFDGKPMYFIRKVIVTYGSTDSEQDLNGFLIMLKNVTEYKMQDEARRNFIATVSHELKTPIAAIKLSIKLLRDERLSVLNQDQDELVESIESEINRLLNITQELLNANELEEGKIKLYPEQSELHEIVDEAVDSVWALAEDKHVTIREVLPERKMPIFIDVDKVTWVLINLLTNAIKYSRAHTEVCIEALTKENEVQFNVIDAGIGIGVEDQKRIFERYYRVQGSNEKGTGLGLSISKEIITQMGGKITVSSELGVGSTFSIVLPLVAQKEKT